MQAILEASEFAYLLHSLEAERVVGVDNQRLLPAEPATRERLLSLGLTRLLEHGWFVARDQGIDADDHLMLMAAVVADPAYTLGATHYLGRDVRQTVTYYANQGIIVEQFMASNGDFVLSRLGTAAELVGRLQDAFAGVLSDAHAQTPLTFAGELFEQAMARARAGDAAALSQALVPNAGLVPELDDRGLALGLLEPIGHIEGAVIAGQTILAWGELAILRAANDTYWLARDDAQAGTVELWTAADSNFRTLVGSLLDMLTVVEPSMG